MLKRNITFTNFDGESKTKTFYFNLTKTELLELESSAEGGLAASLQSIVDSKNAATLISEFKKIIMMAYGERSEDGDRFTKSAALSEQFSQTAAFDQLFMDLAQDDQLASDFILGVMPSDITSQMQTEINQARRVPTPITATAPVEDIPGPVPVAPTMVPPSTPPVA